MDFLKKLNWLIAAAVVAGAVLIFFLWKGCKAGPDHSTDKSGMDSVIHVYTMQKQVLLQTIRGLTAQDSAKDRVIDELRTERINSERDLTERGKIVDQTLNSGKQARIIRDTTKILINCDSLRNLVIEDIPVIHTYQDLTDSLISALSSQAIIKDSIAANWKSAFMHADTAVAYQQAKYISLYADYVKDQSKLKFSNVLEKFGAGVIAALAIGLLIKK